MKSAVLVFPGINRERDMARALRLISGREPAMVWHAETALPPGTDLVVIPGGFSYGDYLRCGAIAARAPIMAAVAAFAQQGGLVLAVCNGFQIACEAGLLPGVLMRNTQLRFICRDVYLRVERSDTPFTRGYNAGQVIRVPVAHGEGNYIADGETIARLEGEGRVLFRYASPDGMVDPDWNHNGAMNAIAGIINERGNVLGMMPHPENHVEASMGRTDGRGLFAGLVDHFKVGRVISNRTCHYPRTHCSARAEAGRVRAHRQAHRPHAEFHRARHFFGDVERALLVQIIAAAPAHAADQGAVGDPGARRERRRHRYRRWARGRVQDGEP